MRVLSWNELCKASTTISKVQNGITSGAEYVKTLDGACGMLNRFSNRGYGDAVVALGYCKDKPSKDGRLRPNMAAFIEDVKTLITAGTLNEHLWYVDEDGNRLPALYHKVVEYSEVTISRYDAHTYCKVDGEKWGNLTFKQGDKKDELVIKVPQKGADGHVITRDELKPIARMKEKTVITASGKKTKVAEMIGFTPENLIRMVAMNNFMYGVFDREIGAYQEKQEAKRLAQEAKAVEQNDHVITDAELAALATGKKTAKKTAKAA